MWTERGVLNVKWLKTLHCYIKIDRYFEFRFRSLPIKLCYLIELRCLYIQI